MDIEQNKRLWFHRRLMVYSLIIVLLVTFGYVLLFLPTERLQYLREIILGFYAVCGITIALYFILTTLHDKNLLPQLIELTDKLRNGS